MTVWYPWTVLLDELIKTGLQRSANEDAELFRIHKIVMGASYSTMRDSTTVFQNLYPCTIYLPEAYGFAYAESLIDETTIRSVMNQDLREVITEQALPSVFRVALCDALYGALPHKMPDGSLTGSLNRRAEGRAALVFADIPPDAHVLLLGPVSEFIAEAKRKNITINVTDRSKQKIGLSYYGTTVEEALPLNTLIERYPKTTHVIATGMIFISDTAHEIFDAIKQHNLSLTLYMETGAWFGEELIAYGAKKVVAEEFPFYDFRGPVPYRIYQAS